MAPRAVRRRPVKRVGAWHLALEGRGVLAAATEKLAGLPWDVRIARYQGGLQHDGPASGSEIVQMFAADAAEGKEASAEIDLDQFFDGLFILQFCQHLRFDPSLLKMAVNEAPDAARAGKEDERHFSQLGPMDNLLPGQGVEFADGDHEFLRKQPLVSDVLFQRKALRRFTHQAKIQVPGLEFPN